MDSKHIRPTDTNVHYPPPPRFFRGRAGAVAMTGTGKRRFPILIAAIAALAVAGAALGLLFSTAEAQETETLVSNIGQGSTLTGNASAQRAQRFTTGPYEYGYTLSTVDVVSVDADGTSFDAKVCTVDGDAYPTSTCTDLAAPGSSAFAAGTITFYAPANTVLEPGTTYAVVLTTPSLGGLEVTYGLTTADGEDAGLEDGWSIADTFDFWNQNLNPDAWGTSASGRSFRIAIKGSQAPEPETTINRPSEIRAYWTDSDTQGSNLQNNCASTEPFRAFWERPKTADEWQAEVTPKNGASNPSFTMSNTGGRWPELTGTVRIDGFSTVSIRVRGRFGDDGWGAWSPRTGLYCLPGEASSAQRALQGRFTSSPQRHDGKKRIKVRVAFSESIDETPKNVGEHGVDVEGGQVTSVRPVGDQAPGGAVTRSAGSREVVWEFEIKPDSGGDVTVTLSGGGSCGEPGAICTADGRALSEGISTTVRGPAAAEQKPPQKRPDQETAAAEQEPQEQEQQQPQEPLALTASFEGMPAKHNAKNAFTFRVAFSEDTGISFRALREDAFTVSGGRVTGGKRVDGRRDLFEMTVRPESYGDVTITLPAGRKCGISGAICTRGKNRRKLTNAPSARVRGPASALKRPGLAPNAPNPFNPSTVIPYRLDTDGPVRLDIYNLLGQRIRTLVDEVQAAGAYRVRWDARDGRGAAVATGVYFIRLHHPGGVHTRRMLYLK